jgi:hypothetical protein
MSDTATPAAAPAAVNPTPAPEPNPSTEGSPPIPPKVSKQAQDLFKLLSTEGSSLPDDVSGQPKPPAKQPDKPEKPAEPATPPKKDDTPAAPPAAPAEKPIKVRGKKPAEETRPEVPKGKKPEPVAPAPAAPAPAPAKTEPDADFESSLDEAERVLLADARDAEKMLGDKYKGRGAKMEAFLKEVAKKTSAPDFDENDPEFAKWYEKNVPKLSVLEVRQLERARVKAEVTQELEPKLEQEKHARWTETEQPKIKAKGDATYVKLINSALPDEVQAAIAERTKGITDPAKFREAVKEVEQVYALETEITQAVVNAATNDLEEFYRLTTENPQTHRKLVEFDPKNAQHLRIVQIMSDVCNEFRTTGGAALKKDGKWFATREEWAGMEEAVRRGELPADTLNGWWTFTNEEIVDRATANIKQAVTAAVKQRIAQQERYGFKRTIAAATATPPAAPAPAPAGSPPAPRPAPAPAGGGTPAPTFGQKMAARLNSQTPEA